MGSVIKRENITISTGEYQKDGKTKKRYRTIGELVTYQNDDGTESQFGEMWGPTGSTKFNVYEQTDRNSQSAPAQQHSAPQQPPQPQAPPKQAPQSATPNNDEIIAEYKRSGQVRREELWPTYTNAQRDAIIVALEPAPI